MERLLLVAILGVVFAAGCGLGGPAPYNYDVDYSAHRFNDAAQSNADVAANVDELLFIDRRGQQVALADYRGKKNILLIFMRGFSGAICPYCQTQTSRLIANYAEFERRDTEILVVYPGAADTVQPFLKAVTSSASQNLDQIPFRILLDEDLKAVDFFKIRASLALPSSYLLDKDGAVRFAYVGTSISDRPSIKALLDQIDLLAE